MDLILNRAIDQTVETKGVLSLPNNSYFKTLELPWLNNKNGVSCIPPGNYPWRKVAATVNIPYPHIEIMNVPGRTGICMHWANFAAGKKVQLKGCITVGDDYADIDKDGVDDITSSKPTLDKLMLMLPDSGTITIK